MEAEIMSLIMPLAPGLLRLIENKTTLDPILGGDRGLIPDTASGREPSLGRPASR